MKMCSVKSASAFLLIPAILVAATIVLADEVTQPDSPSNRAYAIGHDLGAQALASLASDGVEFDAEALVQGFSDAVRREKPSMPLTEMQAVLKRLEREVATRLAKEQYAVDPVFRARAEINEQRGSEFQRRFGARDGVVTLESGVMYEVLHSGSGDRVDPSGEVVLTFTARNVDGEVLISEMNVPTVVAGMIDGGREIVSRMREGDRWRIVLPPDMAFGLGGQAPAIGPNETLDVDVTLVEAR